MDRRSSERVSLHRADELTRPLRLNPWVVVGGALVTGGMFAMLGYGIGKSSAGTLSNALPSHLAMMSPMLADAGPASVNRLIAMTPDGSAVMFVARIGEENAIAYQRLDSEEPVVMPGTIGAQSVPDEPQERLAAGVRIGNGRVVEMRVAAGHIVYVRDDGTMWAAPFDTMTRELTAAPVQIGDGVSLTGTGIAQFAVARNGNVAYVPEEPRSLVFVEKNGTLRNATAAKQHYSSPQFSPDGSRVSVDFTGTDGRDIWILSRGSDTLSRATFSRDAHDATWSADGERITFSSYRTGSLGIYSARPGSAGPPDSLFASPVLSYTGRWLPDGSGLVTTATNVSPRSGKDIVFIPDSGRGGAQHVIVNASSASSPVISRDGRWLAYVSDKSGKNEVYVRPWMREGDETLVSDEGGTEPVWSPDGRVIYYRRNSARRSDLIEATVSTGASFGIAGRRLLFSVTDMAAGTTHANYDISPDGQTFVMVRRSPASRIMVLQNLPAIIRGARAHTSSRR